MCVYTKVVSLFFIFLSIVFVFHAISKLFSFIFSKSPSADEVLAKMFITNHLFLNKFRIDRIATQMFGKIFVFKYLIKL